MVSVSGGRVHVPSDVARLLRGARRGPVALQQAEGVVRVRVEAKVEDAHAASDDVVDELVLRRDGGRGGARRASRV